MLTSERKIEKIEEKIGLLQKTFECPICLELMRNPVTTKCDHKFCRHCLLETIQHQSSAPCPLCKVSFTKRSLQPLPRWNQIVTTVRELIAAFEKDTGVEFNPRHGPPIFSTDTPQRADLDQGQGQGQQTAEGHSRPTRSSERKSKRIAQVPPLELEEVYEDENAVQSTTQVRSHINIRSGFPVQSSTGKGGGSRSKVPKETTLPEGCKDNKQRRKRNIRSAKAKNQQENFDPADDLELAADIQDLTEREKGLVEFLNKASDTQLGGGGGGGNQSSKIQKSNEVVHETVAHSKEQAKIDNEENASKPKASRKCGKKGKKPATKKIAMKKVEHEEPEEEDEFEDEAKVVNWQQGSQQGAEDKVDKWLDKLPDSLSTVESNFEIRSPLDPKNWNRIRKLSGKHDEENDVEKLYEEAQGVNVDESADEKDKNVEEHSRLSDGQPRIFKSRHSLVPQSPVANKSTQFRQFGTPTSDDPYSFKLSQRTPKPKRSKQRKGKNAKGKKKGRKQLEVVVVADGNVTAAPDGENVTNKETNELEVLPVINEECTLQEPDKTGNKTSQEVNTDIKGPAEETEKVVDDIPVLKKNLSKISKETAMDGNQEKTTQADVENAKPAECASIRTSKESVDVVQVDKHPKEIVKTYKSRPSDKLPKNIPASKIPLPNVRYDYDVELYSDSTNTAESDIEAAKRESRFRIRNNSKKEKRKAAEEQIEDTSNKQALDELVDKISQAEDFDLMMSQQFREMESTAKEKRKSVEDIPQMKATRETRSRRKVNSTKQDVVKAKPSRARKTKKSKDVVHSNEADTIPYSCQEPQKMDEIIPETMECVPETEEDQPENAPNEDGNVSIKLEDGEMVDIQVMTTSQFHREGTAVPSTSADAPEAPNASTDAPNADAPNTDKQQRNSSEMTKEKTSSTEPPEEVNQAISPEEAKKRKSTTPAKEWQSMKGMVKELGKNNKNKKRLKFIPKQQEKRKSSRNKKRKNRGSDVPAVSSDSEDTDDLEITPAPTEYETPDIEIQPDGIKQKLSQAGTHHKSLQDQDEKAVVQRKTSTKVEGLTSSSEESPQLSIIPDTYARPSSLGTSKKHSLEVKESHQPDEQEIMVVEDSDIIGPSVDPQASELLKETQPYGRSDLSVHEENSVKEQKKAESLKSKGVKPSTVQDDSSQLTIDPTEGIGHISTQDESVVPDSDMVSATTGASLEQMKQPIAVPLVGTRQHSGRRKKESLKQQELEAMCAVASNIAASKIIKELSPKYKNKKASPTYNSEGSSENSVSLLQQPAVPVRNKTTLENSIEQSSCILGDQNKKSKPISESSSDEEPELIVPKRSRTKRGLAKKLKLGNTSPEVVNPKQQNQVQNSDIDLTEAEERNDESQLAKSRTQKFMDELREEATVIPETESVPSVKTVDIEERQDSKSRSQKFLEELKDEASEPDAHFESQESNISSDEVLISNRNAESYDDILLPTPVSALSRADDVEDCNVVDEDDDDTSSDEALITNKYDTVETLPTPTQLSVDETLMQAVDDDVLDLPDAEDDLKGHHSDHDASRKPTKILKFQKRLSIKPAIQVADESLKEEKEVEMPPEKIPQKRKSVSRKKSSSDDEDDEDDFVPPTPANQQKISPKSFIMNENMIIGRTGINANDKDESEEQEETLEPQVLDMDNLESVQDVNGVKAENDDQCGNVENKLDVKPEPLNEDPQSIAESESDEEPIVIPKSSRRKSAPIIDNSDENDDDEEDGPSDSEAPPLNVTSSSAFSSQSEADTQAKHHLEMGIEDIKSEIARLEAQLAMQEQSMLGSPESKPPDRKKQSKLGSLESKQSDSEKKQSSSGSSKSKKSLNGTGKMIEGNGSGSSTQAKAGTKRRKVKNISSDEDEIPTTKKHVAKSTSSKKRRSRADRISSSDEEERLSDDVITNDERTLEASSSTKTLKVEQVPILDDIHQEVHLVDGDVKGGPHSALKNDIQSSGSNLFPDSMQNTLKSTGSQKKARGGRKTKKKVTRMSSDEEEFYSCKEDQLPQTSNTERNASKSKHSNPDTSQNEVAAKKEEVTCIEQSCEIIKDEEALPDDDETQGEVLQTIPNSYADEDHENNQARNQNEGPTKEKESDDDLFNSPQSSLPQVLPSLPNTPQEKGYANAETEPELFSELPNRLETLESAEMMAIPESLQPVSCPGTPLSPSPPPALYRKPMFSPANVNLPPELVRAKRFVDFDAPAVKKRSSTPNSQPRRKLKEKTEIVVLDEDSRDGVASLNDAELSSSSSTPGKRKRSESEDVTQDVGKASTSKKVRKNSDAVILIDSEKIENKKPAETRNESPARQPGGGRIKKAPLVESSQNSQRSIGLDFPQHPNWIFVASGINKTHHKPLIDKLLGFVGGNFGKTYSKATTHVIVKTVSPGSRRCQRTLKYFQAIAGGAWLVSIDWVLKSVERHKLLPMEPYEIVGDTVEDEDHYGPQRSRMARDAPLLAHHQIFCLGAFQDLTRDDLCDLMTSCGARVIGHPREFDHSDVETKAIVLVESTEAPKKATVNRIQQNFQCLVVIKEWVLDSIGTYSVKDPQEYLPDLV